MAEAPVPLYTNERAELEADWIDFGEECIQDVLLFGQLVTEHPQDMNAEQRQFANILNIIHGLVNEVVFPYFGFESDLDPEVAFFTLLELPLDHLLKMRDIGVTLSCRSRPLCEYIRDHSSNFVRFTLMMDIQELSLETRVKLVGAVGKAYAAFLFDNPHAKRAVIASLGGITDHDVWAVHVDLSLVSMDDFLGNEPNLVEKIALIARPVANWPRQMWKCRLLWGVSDQKIHDADAAEDALVNFLG